MKIKKYDVAMWLLLIVVGVASWYTNQQRTINGFFTSDKWIYLDGLFYTLFSALIVGYVVAKLLKYGNGNGVGAHRIRRK